MSTKQGSGPTDFPDHCGVPADRHGHDQLMIASIDRLARSLTDLQGLIDQITEKGASVHFIKEGLTFATGRENS